jgi:hypothetical protein
MSPTPNPGYGSGALALRWANLGDRLHGRHGRANARLGYLRKPLGGEGKVLWIKAGHTPRSVRLAAELLGAIRGHRLDLRIALTFEEDYPELLERRLAGMQRIGLGYGPADRDACTRRTLNRLEPLGVICVDGPGHRAVARAAAQRGLHLLAYGCEPLSVAVEAAYPHTAEQAAAWAETGSSDNLAPAADPLSLLAEAQADVTLKTLATGGRELEIYAWMDTGEGLRAAAEAWRASALAEQGLLFLLPIEAASATVPGALAVSAWRRTPLEPGGLVLVDDSRWRAAVGSAAQALHVAVPERAALWESMAGGPALTASPSALAAVPWLSELARGGERTEEVFSAWSGWREDGLGARRAGDGVRNRVWAERRAARGVLDELLQRVFEW